MNIGLSEQSAGRRVLIFLRRRVFQFWQNWYSEALASPDQLKQPARPAFQVDKAAFRRYKINQNIKNGKSSANEKILSHFLKI